MPGAPFQRCRVPSLVTSPTLPFNGVVFGNSLAGDTGGQTPISTHLQALRPADTWTFVSFGGHDLSIALSAGSTGFQQAVHTPLYVPGAQNLVFIEDLLIDCNDTNDTVAQIYDRLTSLITQIHSFGWLAGVIGVGGTSEFNDPGATPYRRPERIGVNNWLRSGDGGSRPSKAGAEYFFDIETIEGLGQSDLPLSGDGDPLLFLNDTPTWGAIHRTSYANSLIAGGMNVVLG